MDFENVAIRIEHKETGIGPFRNNPNWSCVLNDLADMLDTPPDELKRDENFRYAFTFYFADRELPAYIIERLKKDGYRIRVIQRENCSNWITFDDFRQVAFKE